MFTENYYVLAQNNPAAATSTDIYTVAAGKKAVVASIIVCNMGVAGSFRISVAVAGLALAPKQYLYYDLPIDANDTFIATIGLTLGPADVVRVYASHVNMAFNLSGVELTTV